MRKAYKNRLALACFLGSVAVATAQQTSSPSVITVVPKLVHFAGAVHLPPNQPAGPVGATFAMYSEQEGGTPLWTEDQNVDLDASGNYTVLLGSTKNEGVPSELFAAGEARWLQVRFHMPGEVEQPRVLLVSVPYALKAADADTLGGKPASAYLLAGSSASGSAQAAETASTTSAALVPSAVTAAKSTAHPNNIVSGNEGYFPYFYDSFNDLGNSNMTMDYTACSPGYPYNCYNIGIGTTQAQVSLDIQTGLYPQIGVAALQVPPGYTADYVSLFASAQYGPAFYWDSGHSMRFGAAGPALYNDLSFQEYMRITGSGNVGIGTQTPTVPLDVIANNTTAILGQTNGTAFSSTGVFGEATSSTSNETFGVYGSTYSGAGSGVLGISQNTSTSGSTYGVAGWTASSLGAGVVGSSNEYSSTGGTLIGTKKIGVWGDQANGSSSPIGVLATADNGVALLAQNNSPGTWATLFAYNFTSAVEAEVFGGGGTGGQCNVYNNGNLDCTGTISPVVRTSEAREAKFYGVASPENWFEDFGSGQLSGGAARVSLDPAFASTVNTGETYHVFLTPNGDCKGLYVASKGVDGFEVRELGGGTSNISFDYRIVAKRQGYESIRMPDVTERMNKMRQRQAELQAKRADGATPRPPHPPAIEAAQPKTQLVQTNRSVPSKASTAAKPVPVHPR